ncbi:MAG: ComF family protein [Syntrophobacterales bacterium]
MTAKGNDVFVLGSIRRLLKNMPANTRNLRRATAQMQKKAHRFPALAASLVQELALFIYPPTCPGCGNPLHPERPEHFCSDCLRTLEFISEPYCPVCGVPYAKEIQNPHLCGDCLAGIHSFDRARSTGSYRGSLREVLHRFKYGGQTSLARPLAHMLIAPGKHLARLHKIDRIIPVPLHPKRLRQRGFNQASLLARRLGSALRISVDYASLKRSRWTEPQTGLTRRQRAANVKGAFSLRSNEKLKGKGILVVDDVLTTGETVNQCVRVLKKDGGATEVAVLTVARTVEI